MDHIITKIEEFPPIIELKMKLRKKTYENSTAVSITALEIFKNLIKKFVEKNNVKTFKDLVELLVRLEEIFGSIDPLQFSIGNIIKRILFIVREEEAKVHPFQEEAEKTPEDVQKRTIVKKLTFQSYKSLIDFNDLNNNLNNNKQDDDENSGGSADEGIFGKEEEEDEESPKELKASLSNILNGIQELKDELDTISEAIKSQTLEYIQDNDVILTSNHSEQLEEFFIEASKSRKFKVIVAESAPSLSGIIQAQKLMEKGIDTKVISDSALYAIMPKINKVIIGTRSVIANGGLISYNGAYNLCLCAHMFSIPVVVVGGIFKFTPSYPFGEESINEYLSPDAIYSDEVEYKNDISNIAFNIPGYDYVPPELITIYITDHGSQNPKNIYRLFSELYSQEDYFS